MILQWFSRVTYHTHYKTDSAGRDQITVSSNFFSICNSPSWKKIRNSILYEKSFAYSKIISTDCPDNYLLLAIVKKINRGLAQSPWHQYNLFFNFQFVTWIIKNLHGRAWIFSPTSNPDLILTLDSDCCTLFIPFQVNHQLTLFVCVIVGKSLGQSILKV